MPILSGDYVKLTQTPINSMIACFFKKGEIFFAGGVSSMSKDDSVYTRELFLIPLCAMSFLRTHHVRPWMIEPATEEEAREFKDKRFPGWQEWEDRNRAVRPVDPASEWHSWCRYVERVKRKREVLKGD